MKKQVLAILLATLLILTTFAACGKKYLIYTDKDGVEHPVLTDAEGNTMVNEFGQIVVGVTDSRGHLVTDENGENETRAIAFPSEISYGSTYETPTFKLTLPEKLWYVDGNRLQKKNSEIYAEINAFEGKTLEEAQANNEENLENLKNAQNGKFTYEFENFTLTNGVSVHSFKAENRDDSGTITEYMEGYYFVSGEILYKFLVVIPAEEAGSVNFVDILNMIKFR